MQTVLLRAPLLTQSGYGVHARQLFKWLKTKDIKLYCDLIPWGDTPWLLHDDQANGIIGEVYKHVNGKPATKPDVAISLQLPNEWEQGLGHCNIGLTAAVETDRCNPAWIDACNQMDAVIVPSKHTVNTLQNTNSITTKLFVVPEAYNDNIRSQKVNDFRFSTNFNFLLFGQLTGQDQSTDRKNIFATLKWICETFKDDPDVGIVLKTNLGRNTQIDRDRTIQLLKSCLSTVRYSTYPKVHLIHGDLNDNEVSSLYHDPSIKAFVLLSHGEGFCLPMLDAAVAAMPIIATGWSGYLDFLSAGKFIKIAHTLDNIHKNRIDSNIFMANTRWAYPNEDDFKKKIKRFRESPDVPKQWALELQSALINTHSQTAINKLYDEVLGALIC